MQNLKNSSGWQKLVRLLQEQPSPQRLSEVLQLLLTTEEQQQLADRVVLIQALLSGEKTQRQIAADLNISIAKVTRGSHQVKNINTTMKKHLQQGLR